MKNEKYDVKKLVESKPGYSIDHILKERYPRFNDALNDLDDALCLVTLFSNLPKHELLKINSETVLLCQRLVKEFMLYCAVTQNFKKGFISIKGIYLNIEMLGNNITWLSPFNYPQKMPFDVDYEIMLNFLELYSNLMKFINLKLFKDIGLEYPPPVENLELPFFGFNSLDLHNLQENVSSKNSKEKTLISEELNCDSEELKKIFEEEKTNKKLKSLFKNFVFYFSREIPKEIFGLAVLNSGGLFGDDSDNSSFPENDHRITHYVVDRPSEFITFNENKEYIQPQWIFDCINSNTLLPVSEYQPGKKLPPHLSPFFEFDKGKYISTLKAKGEDTEQIQQVHSEHLENNKENLNEMLISKNKKKLLVKIREEKLKKKKTNMK